MESWNNNSNGKFPIYANGESINSRLEHRSGSSDPRPEYPDDGKRVKAYDYVAQGYGPSNSLNPRPTNGQNSNDHSNNPPRLPAYDPAALLNPRGAQNGSSSHTFGQPKLSARPAPSPQPVFEFASPWGSPATPATSVSNGAPSERKHGFAQYGNGQMQGMASFVDRMHNVTDRDMVPQKRRKCEKPCGEGSGSQFNGSSSGGAFGSYIKEQRAEGQKEGAGKQVHDLSTVDDDEDVQIIGDELSKEVCYGRIEGADINAFKVPTPKPGQQAFQPGYWPQVKIVLRRPYGQKTTVIHAADSTREIIGCIDVNTALGLAPLLDSQYGIRTTARILTRPKKPDDEPPGSAVSVRYGLDVNLYGPKKYAIAVGRHLSQKQVWLRTPLFVEAGVELYNPHAIEKTQRPSQPARPYSSYASRSQGPVRTTEEIRNDVLGVFDSLQKSENLPEMDPSPLITTELLKHQKQGLYFMTNREKEHDYSKDEKSNNSLWRVVFGNNGQRSYYNVITGDQERKSPPQVLGGILADMMGLGKTLTTLSVIATTLDDAKEWAKLTPSQPEERELPKSKATKNPAPPKVEPAPLALNCKTTLLVAPLSVVANWEEQIKQHTKPGSLKYYIYHGTSRIKDVKKLAEYDIIITTYGSVASEFNFRNKQKKGNYPLEEMNWFRIVLDEAHMIREQSTLQFKAICRLSAQRRWACTGTPVQNRLEDLGALMTFLRFKPFDGSGFSQYILSPFKICDPEIIPKLRLLVDSITLRRLKDKIDLPKRRDHLVKLNFSDEERAVYDIFAKNASDRIKVITSQQESSLGGKTYVHILQSILRLRLVCAHGKDLLSEEDLKVMSGLSKDSAIDLDGDDFEDHDGLSPKQAYDMYKLMRETNTDACLMCNRKIGPREAVDSDAEPRDEAIGYMTPCFHIICSGCIDNYKAQMEGVALGSGLVECPTCHQHISLTYFPLKQGGVDDDEDSRIKAKDSGKQIRDLSNYSGPHTKTKALLDDLMRSKQESEKMPNEPPIKSVVFSGWTSHLDLIQLALSHHSIPYTRLDGKMSRTARGAAMAQFRDDPSILVILVSITAGGLGLNLTSANKVYVMEPQYNPAAEAQAVDRVHRLGQKREVQTVRYIMKDSFEEKMLDIQDKKKKLASLSMDGQAGGKLDKKEAARTRLEELKDLFRK
jgi:SNF2 family DNA or RNA helicase